MLTTPKKGPLQTKAIDMIPQGLSFDQCLFEGQTTGQIQDDFWGGSIYSYNNTYFSFSDRHARANSVDPDQMPQNVAYDQGLHCLPLTLHIQTDRPEQTV